MPDPSKFYQLLDEIAEFNFGPADPTNPAAAIDMSKSLMNLPASIADLGKTKMFPELRGLSSAWSKAVGENTLGKPDEQKKSGLVKLNLNGASATPKFFKP
jgi:hypothetical protein